MSRFTWIEVSEKKKELPEDQENQSYDEAYYMKIADEKSDKGEYEAALRYYSRILDLDLRVEKAWLGQLLCLIDLGEFKEAVTWSDKALEIFPNSPEIIAVKALAWGRSGNLYKAKGFSDSSLKNGRNSSFIWWVRGDVLMGENEKNAEFCFRKAGELDRNNWRLILRIGKTFLSMGKFLKAREYFIRARNLNQDNPLLWYWLGIAYQHQGRYDEAKNCLERALELKPRNPEFRLALEKIHRIGILPRAIKKLKNFFS